ncbi:MAG: cupin domain-containing protein [Chloroflexales bacterium]|nr:cupin domain-containing protein [Chloroflexales bacterium]
MRIISKGDIKTPVRNSDGEIIYEMIGEPPELGGTKRHSLALIVLPPGRLSARHYHQASEETYFILHGTARIIIGAKEFMLRPGQACLIEPHERHEIFNDGPETLEFLAVSAPPWTPDDSTFV